jgi:two-component system sensor histidine kinase CpxA
MTARSTEPPAYWVLSMVPAVETDRGYLPLILVMRSDSLTGHGVFFDPKPWLFAGIGVLLVSGLIWVPMAFGLTSSLWRIRKATGRIAEGDFAVSIPDVARRDELGDLGRSVQTMAERLEAHVSGQKRFLGDIAHELCSPISRLQAAIGILEEGGGSEETRQRYLRKVGAEVQQMSALVNELLSFSKASLRRELSVSRVGLRGLVQGVLDREEPAPDEVRVEIPERLEVLADPDLLGRALGNLVRNARRYAGGAGAIEISAERSDGQIIVRVSDSGPGVPEAALPRLFDPFYRPDASRTRESGGTGLGLAIVKTCVEACGGTVSASLRQPAGLEVTIRLPESG